MDDRSSQRQDHPKFMSIIFFFSQALVNKSHVPYSAGCGAAAGGALSPGPCKCQDTNLTRIANTYNKQEHWMHANIVFFYK